MRRRELEAGEVLFTQGAPTDSVYLVEHGCIKLVVHPHDAKQMVLYRALTGEIFAEEHLVQDRYSYSAIAEVDTILSSVSRQVLLGDVMRDRAVLERYLACLSGRYHQLRINFERLGIPSAKARVLDFLEAITRGKSHPIDLSGQIKSLSDDLNLTHEAVYRALRDLESDGAIQRSEGMIRVLRHGGATPTS